MVSRKMNVPERNDVLATMASAVSSNLGHRARTLLIAKRNMRSTFPLPGWRAHGGDHVVAIAVNMSALAALYAGMNAASADSTKAMIDAARMVGIGSEKTLRP